MESSQLQANTIFIQQLSHLGENNSYLLLSEETFLQSNMQLRYIIILLPLEKCVTITLCRFFFNFISWLL